MNRTLHQVSVGVNRIGMHRLITWARRRSLERQQRIVNEAWNDSHKLEQALAARAEAARRFMDACKRKDTRDQRRYAEALQRATTEVLRAEIAR